MDASTISRCQIPTPVGLMIAAAVDEGICLLDFADGKMIESNFKRLSKHYKATVVDQDHPHFKKLREELAQYFAGKLKTFSIPVVLAGTDFQKKVWDLLQTISFGESRTYKEQAALYGNPLAIRAVATANGLNKISILIPCHRVIGSDGKLVGYSGGLERKKFLLDLEQGKRP